MTVVLDASALLALLNDEPGAEIVKEALPQAVISTVNLAEVVGKLLGGGMPESQVIDGLEGLGLHQVSFDVQQAYASGFLRGSTRLHGLSLGDRACLSLAKRLGVPALTSDRAWSALDIGIQVLLTR